MKLEVNLKQNPYDIIIERELLKGRTMGQVTLEPQRLHLSRTIMWELYMQKKLLSLEHEGFEVVVFIS